MRKQTIKYTCAIMAVVMLLQMTVYAKTASQFRDIDEHWAYEDLIYVINNGIMGEMDTDGCFQPDATATRAMIITALYRLAGQPATSSFSVRDFEDVPLNEWYSQPIHWAKQIGIIGGDNNYFYPNNPLPREQLAVIMCRYAGYKGYNLVSVDSPVDKFPDFDQTSTEYQTAMKWAIRRQMFVGRDQGYLCPKASATRAEVAACIHRFVVNITTVYYPQITQAESEWCWAACAEMLGKNVSPASARTQYSVVQFVKGSATVNEAANLSETCTGAEYVSYYAAAFNYVYAAIDEFAIIDHLNKGYAIIAMRGKYDGLKRLYGHDVLIVSHDREKSITYFDPSKYKHREYVCLFSEFCNDAKNNLVYEGTVFVM